MRVADWLKDRVFQWVDSHLDADFRAKLRALPTRQNEYGYDPFGFNRDDAKMAALIAKFFHPHLFPRRGSRHRARSPPGASCSSPITPDSFRSTAWPSAARCSTTTIRRAWCAP